MTSKHLIPADDADDDLGPAMAGCSKQERLFVRALFEHAGHGAGAKAARVAGYGNKDSPTGTFARSANRLFNRPRVIAAIAEVTGQSLRSDGPMAVKTVREIMKDKTHKDRLKAARTVIERADPAEQRFSGQMDHTITDNRVGSDAEGIKFLAMMKRDGANREFLINFFGANGLPRLEKLLARDEAAAAEKLNAMNGAASAIVYADFSEIPAAADGDDK